MKKPTIKKQAKEKRKTSLLEDETVKNTIKVLGTAAAIAGTIKLLHSMQER